MQICLFV